MAKEKPTFVFEQKPSRKAGNTYTAKLRLPEGATQIVGTVRHFFIKHLDMMGWEATTSNGEHRAVHHQRWQAAEALVIDLTNYPFPIAR